MLTDKLLQAENDERQTRRLVRDGAPQRQDRNLLTGPRVGSIPWHIDWLTDWPTVSRNVTSISRAWRTQIHGVIYRLSVWLYCRMFSHLNVAEVVIRHFEIEWFLIIMAAEYNNAYSEGGLSAGQECR
jgi:hypothetical protein